MGTLGIATLGTAVDLTGLRKGIAQGQAETKKLLGGLDISVSKMGLIVAGAVTAVAAAVNKMVDETVQYGQAVTDLSRATEMSAEDSSRLIQAADDAFVSQESLTTALKVAVRQGFLPTIENVKILADQYNALSDPMARNALLIKTFGRNGLEMGKLLEMGSEGIQKAADASDRLGLTLSGDNLKAIKAYKQQIDELNDQWAGLKTSVGLVAIPILLKLTSVTDGQTKALNKMRSGAAGATVETNALAMAEREATAAAEEAARMAELLAAANQNVGSEAHGIVRSFEAIPSLAGQAYAEVLRLSGQVVSYFEGIDTGLSDKIAGMLEQIAFKEAGGTELQGLTDQVKQALDEGKISPAEAQTYFEQLFVATQQLQVDIGNLTAGQAASEINRTLGTSLTGAALQALAINQNLDKMERTITITLRYEREGSFGTGPGLQHGGPVRRGMSYIVGEAGPEAFIPEGDGRIIDARQTQSMVNSNNRGGSVTIEEMNINNGLDDRAALLQIKRLAGL